MQERMPSPYVRAIQLASRSGLRGEDLHSTVMDLVLSYKLNYEMTFPLLNHVPMIVEYTRELCLPGRRTYGTSKGYKD
jgi:RNA polymerase I-specific transcription initiation factor RRN7